MKRTKRTLESKTDRAVQLTAEDLARIKGGATAIEYGLVLAAPPPLK